MVLFLANKIFLDKNMFFEIEFLDAINTDRVKRVDD